MSKKGHVPIRMCIGCREKKKKAELVRWIQGPDGAVVSGEKRDSEGRGYYLCPDLGCLKRAQKKVAWLRSVAREGFEDVLRVRGRS